MKALLCVMLAAGVASAQPAPPALERVGLDERVGTQLPLDTAFIDTRLGPRTLRAVLDPEKPTILLLAYARCTMLCNLVLRGVVEVARKIQPVAGTDYKLVVISLDDHETLDEARRLQGALLSQLGRGDWVYLTGHRDAIDAIASPLGFRYAWDQRTQQYAHPAAVFVLTPEGRVSRYLHGVQFDPLEVTTALDDAANGRVLSTPAADVLRCFRFDPSARTNATWVERFMKIGALLVAALMFAVIAGLVRRKAR